MDRLPRHLTDKHCHCQVVRNCYHGNRKLAAGWRQVEVEQPRIRFRPSQRVLPVILWELMRQGSLEATNRYDVGTMPKRPPMNYGKVPRAGG